MNTAKIRVLVAAVSAIAITATSHLVSADEFPTKTVEVVTHAGAGGGD